VSERRRHGSVADWQAGARHRQHDIGSLVAFIASPLADFINGANYRIDGGQVQAVN
jgi:3-oxoacyl-[acyl-carrier protein] reductase